MPRSPFLPILLIIALGVSQSAGTACVGGKWDTAYAWVKDCTPDDPSDGRFAGGRCSRNYTGETKITVGSEVHTLSWRLRWFESPLPGARLKDSLPLILGLHPWTEGAAIDDLLNAEPSLLMREGAWEDVLFLSVALETGNNLNTWWDGSKVDGRPVTWAMDAIVELLRARIGDACALLAASGAAPLQGRAVDVNRVYAIGTSMGGSGVYHLALRHPELFAAVHANAGFADYKGAPCGYEGFCISFTRDFIGSAQEKLPMRGLDGRFYPARDYSDMSWFAGAHDGASWSSSLGQGRRYEPPYLVMTHGSTDAIVNISSADRLAATLSARRFGFSYWRHPGGHPDENFARLDRLLGFRRDRSYPALANRDSQGGRRNFLDEVGWLRASIVDEADLWRIELTGKGTVDVTPRRLQRFHPAPGQAYLWRVGGESGPEGIAYADAGGVLTIPGVAVESSAVLSIHPAPSGIRPTVTPRLRSRTTGHRVRFAVPGKDESVDGLGIPGP